MKLKPHYLDLLANGVQGDLHFSGFDGGEPIKQLNPNCALKCMDQACTSPVKSFHHDRMICFKSRAVASRPFVCFETIALREAASARLFRRGEKYGASNHRHGFASYVPSMLQPPLIFGGLAIALWTWKCCMMVLFQNKIIYMPSLPPNARWEKVADYAKQCGKIKWREETIRSSDGTDIALCLASVKSKPIRPSPETPGSLPLYIVYFQGNASSIPPRLPLLSPVLKYLADSPSPTGVEYILVCVSYRGYWKSKGSASERGIFKDAAAALQWIADQESGKNKTEQDAGIPVVLWGQSIGAGVATNLAASRQSIPRNIHIRSLILETPFTSIRDMLVALYPQKWLPYRRLWPFLRNHLDSKAALRRMAQATPSSLPEITILEAGRDELVPKAHGDLLESICLEAGLPVRRHAIDGALHNEVMFRPGGREVVVQAIRDVARGMDHSG